MCGRYALYGIEPLEDEYGLPEDYEGKPNYNVAPTHVMPVVTQDGSRMMRWGLIPKWAKDEKIGYKLINARAETIFEKPMWKSIVTKQRCLIPANGFYEWQKRDDGKQPYFIHPKDQDMFMFAGIWETWKHDDVILSTYTILTTSPNKEMESIHNRMPVILRKDDHDQWLGADTQDDIEPLLLPYGDGILEKNEVSKDVNSVNINDSHLLMTNKG